MKIDRTEIGCEIVDCIQYSQDRGQWWAVVTNLCVYKGEEFLDQLSE